MPNYEQYFIDLIKEATNALGLKLNKIDSHNSFVSFTINDVNMFAPVIKLEGGARFRVFYDATNAEYDSSDLQLLSKVNNLIHHFNLFEGGLTQLTLIENETGNLKLVFKAFDICLGDMAIGNEYVKEYHLNLIADIIGVANRMTYYKLNYLDQLEELSSKESK